MSYFLFPATGFFFFFSFFQFSFTKLALKGRMTDVYNAPFSLSARRVSQGDGANCELNQ
jgi:hypothetical protein